MESRTNQSFKNVTISVFGQVITTVCQFIVRTFFIKYLGKEYLGINGVFLNILNVLSLAELGFGSAILIMLYKPVAYGDIEKIKSYMYVYKKIYTVVGLIVLLGGLICCPFIPYFVDNSENIGNLQIIFLLYLLNSVCTYLFFAYRSMLVTAHQKKYYVTLTTTISNIAISTIQVIFLFLFQNIYLYLCVPIVVHILSNLMLGTIIGKKYPYILEKNCRPLTTSEKKEVKTNVFSVLIYKLSTTFNTSSDSIIISIFIGTVIVGMYSNYLLIINAVSTIAYLVVHSLTDSVGNLNVSASNEKKHSIFVSIDYLNYFIYGFCFVALGILLNPFIELWIGNEYIFKQEIVLIFVLNFLMEGILQPSYAFRNACGLYRKGRIRPLISLILNIIFSVFFAQIWGVAGVIGATILSRLATTSWYEPLLVYKNVFNQRPIKYYLIHLYYLFIFVLSYFIIAIIKNLLAFSAIINFIILVSCCAIIPCVLFIALTFFLPQAKELINILKSYVIVKFKRVN